jgi:hypothetical protein
MEFLIKIYEIYGIFHRCCAESLKPIKMPGTFGAGSRDLFPCGMKTFDFSQIWSSQLGAGSWEKIRIG